MTSELVSQYKWEQFIQDNTILKPIRERDLAYKFGQTGQSMLVFGRKEKPLVSEGFFWLTATSTRVNGLKVKLMDMAPITMQMAHDT